MPYLYDNIPATLRQRPNWVAWGVRGAPPKAPFNPSGLLSGKASPAKAGMPETWSGYEAAVDCVRRGLAQGIGYEFDGSGVYGVDLDHVIDEAGTISERAAEIVRNLNSYTEISPSGTGLHILVTAPGANITRHRKKDGFVEIYSEARYFTVTGNIIGNIKTIEARTVELQAVHDKYLPSVPSQRTAATPPAVPAPNAADSRFLRIGLERDKVLSALWAGERRHANESSDDIALMNKLAYWCNADPDAVIRAFLSSPYHSQKDEAHMKKSQRMDYLTNTANKACTTVYSTAVADYERRQQSRERERKRVNR